MKLKNIEAMQRALGIIEGVAFGIEESAATALTTAIEIIDEVIDDERETRNEP